MAEQDPNKDEATARQRLLELLKSEDNWRFEPEDRVRGEARTALRWLRDRAPSDFEIIDYICQLLHDNFPIEPVELTNREGTGWVMKNPDGRHIYIKLQIVEDGVFDVALVLSCHTSKHKPK